MKKYILILLLITTMVPSVAFASWWNPFSWNLKNVFNYIFNIKKEQVIESPSQKDYINEDELSTTNHNSTEKEDNLEISDGNAKQEELQDGKINIPENDNQSVKKEEINKINEAVNNNIQKVEQTLDLKRIEQEKIENQIRIEEQEEAKKKEEEETRRKEEEKIRKKEEQKRLEEEEERLEKEQKILEDEKRETEELEAKVKKVRLLTEEMESINYDCEDKRYEYQKEVNDIEDKYYDDIEKIKSQPIILRAMNAQINQKYTEAMEAIDRIQTASIRLENECKQKLNLLKREIDSILR
ncbi:MAG: hypothetical protein PHU32_05790 [Candidatus ainarchaeum sp.]|nr:hypothetical protein [Candidatus ainarchaeum sp.]